MRAAALLAVLSVVLLQGAAAAEGRYGAFGDWSVGCDNRRDCRAIGAPGNLGTGMGALGLERAAEPEAVPALWVAASAHVGGAALADGGAVEIFVDDVPLGRFALADALSALDDSRRVLGLSDETLRRAVLDALPRARRLRFSFAGDRTLDISLAGAAEALAFIDERQHRAGTLTALVRRGDRPAAAIPAPPALAPPPQSRADAGWPALPDRLPDEVVRGIVQAHDVCDTTREPSPHSRAIGRLSAELVLVESFCARGAYNESYAYHLWNERTGGLAPAEFAVPEGLRPLQGLLTNPDFDQATLTISHFAKGRGLGDCGAGGSWRWDGSAFRLTGYVYMPHCQGLEPELWHTLHRSE